MKLKIFAVILVPLQKERRVTEDNLGAFSTLVSLYNPMDCYEESVTKDMKKLLNDVSGTNKHRFLARYLINFPFFKRVKP